MSNVKVSRDGSVVKDGKTIGRVDKEIRQGMFATLMGAGYSATGTPYWVPFDADGRKLSDGFDTRKRAVALVEKVALPLTVDEIRVERGLGTGRDCVTAGVRYLGHYFGVSRYAHEEYWVVDYLVMPGAFMPTFANGTGSRVTRVNALKEPLATAATEAAIAAGVWPMSGE